jgi:hypothetical protein
MAKQNSAKKTRYKEDHACLDKDHGEAATDEHRAKVEAKKRALREK